MNFSYYSCITLRTSSLVVIPFSIFSNPSSYIVNIPLLLAYLEISETILIDDELRHYIMSHVSISDISRYARSKGMLTMYEDGLEKIEKGITTREEVLRVIQE
jgi:hypothetical protein